jgi:PAS domain S-box-containing protein
VFFHHAVGGRQESSVNYAFSGMPKLAFERLGLPRNMAAFGSMFKDGGAVRLADLRADRRHATNSPFQGVPQGDLPVCSYLAIPVISRNGEVHGGMFFGHPDVAVFTERAERIAVGIASHASIAIDNAKLYAKLESSLARLNFSLSALALGDWSWNAATDEIRVSARTAEIFGVSDVTGTREAMRSVLHPDDRDWARETSRRAVEAGTDYDIEYRVLHPTAGERWVAAKGRPQFGDDGKVTGMMGVVQDITERKRVELALRESRAKLESHTQMLEQHVAERTAKLRETIGELEAFSYSVSHDMRTPLRAMQGYADRLLRLYRPKLDAEGVHHLERISINAQRLELLVRDVLAYSKVTKEEIQLEPINLDTFVEGLIASDPELRPEGVTIAVKRPLPRVQGHEAYLSQVFTNLIGNAIKFAAEGRNPAVEIRAVTNGNRATISVCDNGIGIAPEHFERIFEIFGRVYSDKKFDGTGIGLSIVKKAVQRMGGQVSVQSTLGAGSCFSFTLQTA